MATEHGAATTPFGAAIGALSPGCEADLVLLDHDAVTRPYQDPETPLVDVLVHRARPSAIEAVMVGGEVIYANGRFLRIDREMVLEAIRESLAAPLTPAERDRRRLSEAIFPHVKAFYDRWLPEDPGAPHTLYNAR
jgi:hypothetical protein